MENHELNKKVIANVKNRIVVSNLEREESMKLSKRKRIISMCTVGVILLSGSFLTVNAATEGKLAEEIKSKYLECIKIDESKYKATMNGHITDENGDDCVTYHVEELEGSEEMEITINETNLDQENLTIETKMTSDEGALMQVEIGEK